MKLYELTGNVLQLTDRLENGDVTEETKQALTDTLESLEFDVEEKTENIVKLLRNMDAEREAYAREKARFAEKEQAIKKKQEWLKDYLYANMKALGREKVETELFKVSIRKNPPSVKVLDEMEVPTDYLVFQQPTLDKKKILNDLKNNIEVKGCALEQGESLYIK